MAVAQSPPLTDEQLDGLNDRFSEAPPEQILSWGTATYPDDVVLTCSFQHEGVVLAHMLRTIKADIPVVFIDTRFHFKETLEYRDTIVKLLGLNLQQVNAKITFDEFKERYGADLNRRDPDLCCRINKVEPLLKALEGVRCWINGRRRDQTADRRGIRHIEMQGGMVKLNPLARWTSKDTYRYLHAHTLPLHPLWEKGYTSIGCEPCTALPLSEGDERSGRWAESAKRECGIHTVLDAGGDGPGSDS